MDYHFALAVEHVAWCISEKWVPAEVYAALEQPMPAGASWNDAIWAVARASEALDRPTKRLAA